MVKINFLKVNSVLKRLFYFMCPNVFNACMHVHLCVSDVQGVQKRVSSSRNGIMYGCKSLLWCHEQNLRPLQVQQVFLTTELLSWPVKVNSYLSCHQHHHYHRELFYSQITVQRNFLICVFKIPLFCVEEPMMASVFSLCHFCFSLN